MVTKKLLAHFYIANHTIRMRERAREMLLGAVRPSTGDGVYVGRSYFLDNAYLLNKKIKKTPFVTFAVIFLHVCHVCLSVASRRHVLWQLNNIRANEILSFRISLICASPYALQKTCNGTCMKRQEWQYLFVYFAHLTLYISQAYSSKRPVQLCKIFLHVFKIS